ncbi:NERD domain-containing protein [Neobacillus sp. D3-1R]|uniref:NERD domain-containing protein n=1 Tax=Neobacillus sp. D3-1R TaxID=3445778 RepID=UPI003F9F1DE0
MSLFLKERLIPLKILLLEVILRRLPLNHPKRSLIEKELYRRKAGWWGENEVDKKLKLMNHDKYFILADLRLPNGDTFFQIDTLLLTTRFALIIEAKTISGTLYFDLDNHQLIRKNNDGTTEGFGDPVSQARFHQQQLREWLLKHKLPLFPIDFLIIITNPSTIFHLTPPGHPFAKKIQSISGLTWEIDKLEDFYQKEVISEKEIRKIGKALIKDHTPLTSEILQQYDISKSELLTGVQCPDCQSLPLTYHRGKWHCPNCKGAFKDAHLPALQDYALLYKPTITNSEFREFLHIPNPYMATKMLKELDGEVSGINKGRVYHLKY